MQAEAHPEGRRAIRRQRGRRTLTGANVLASLALAALLTALLNFGAYRYLNVRWDVSSLRYFTLSEKTLNMLGELDGEISIVTVFDRESTLSDDIKRLLDEYVYAASRLDGLTVRIEHVDPDRHLARTRELADRYDLTEANLLVVEVNERWKVLPGEALVDYDRVIDDSRLQDGILWVKQERQGFRGEQMISSAIHSLQAAAGPTVYFLTGNGERDIREFSNPAGYSGAARLLARDNIEVRTVLLTGEVGVPDDCDALIVAGPDRRFAEAERKLLADYLARGGRMLFMLDSGVSTGLEGLLEQWGVALDRDVVVGVTLSGRELLVHQYGEHGITRGLKNIVTQFYMPRSVEPVERRDEGVSVAADRPMVTVLARTEEGWAERNLTQSPPRFDPGTDRAGPISIAVAVERGAASAIDVNIRPTRAVVVGDADFVSNGALKSGAGGNTDFFLSAVNWLLEREALMAISAKAPIDVSLDMNEGQAGIALVLIVFALPLAASLLGLVVWIRRRA